MVWRKVIICALLLFALVVPMAPRANAATAQLDMDAFMQAQEFAKLMVSFSDDYLFVITGEREFVMYVGDISYSDQNNRYTGIGISSYALIYTEGEENPTIQSSFIYNFSFTPIGLFFSNLGFAVDFMPKEGYILYAILFVLCIALCCYLLRSIFSFCLRRRT